MNLRTVLRSIGMSALAVLPGFVLPRGAWAAAEEAEGPAVTVYSTADPAGFDPQRFIAQQRRGYNPSSAWEVPGFGIVKEIRSVRMAAGVNDLPFTDVAQFIDPTTVSFTDLTDPTGTTVLEQNFRFDLVSPAKLLERFLDRSIRVIVPSGDSTEELAGTLLSAQPNNLVLKTKDGLRIVNGYGQSIRLGELPAGLITKPTLVWKVQARQAGDHRIRTTYQTGGLTWRADYNLVLKETSAVSRQSSAGDAKAEGRPKNAGGRMKADMGAWVTMMNLSGAAYHHARLKLIAGDVQRVQSRGRERPMKRRLAMAMGEMANAGFQEKAFFEYHLYTLPRRTDILANTTQQIMLFPTARDVGVEKVLVYYGASQFAHWTFGSSPNLDRNLGNQSNPKVDVYVRFKNEEKNHLGMPLPKGKVRVYQEDEADGTLEFIGEDLIDHTAKDEEVLIKLGQSFDVVGERTRTNFTRDDRRHVLTESFKIQVRNHKDADQKVIIKENLFRWMNWEITESSDKFEKIDSRTIHFNVKVPANGSKTVTYTVRYTW